MRTDSFGEPATMLGDQASRFTTEVLVATHAGTALEATRCEPADADLIANAHSLRARCDCDDSPDDFVAGHEWEPGVAPVVVDHRQVGVANAAMLDRDFDPLLRERARLELDGLEGRAGRCSGIGTDRHRALLGLVRRCLKRRMFSIGVQRSSCR
jgi:hypothetical protein